MLDHVINLLAQSETHHDWTVEQINRCITPPVNLHQSIGVFEDGLLVAWASWAYLSEEMSDMFLEGDYKIQPEDWRSGDVLVFMDCVAPFGHCRRIIRMCRNLFPNQTKAQWRRHQKQRRFGVTVHG